jgi:predicted ATP-dependent endonuclease of OLD family
MKIKNISIKNYRSIQDVSFDIKTIANKNCHILLGINESGKSNILKALYLKNSAQDELDYQNNCEKNAELKEEEISVSYELLLFGAWDKVFIVDNIPKDLLSVIKLEKVERILSISKNNVKQDYFHIRIKDNKKEFSKYVFFNGEIQLKNDTNLKKNEDAEVTNLLDKEPLEEYLEIKLFKAFEYSTPKIIFWRSSEEKYLINNSVDLNQFKDNHDISIPLKNCFNIAGIDKNEIAQRINSIVGSPSRKSQLQDELANKVTEHINKVWKEHKINIRFEIDNMQLTFLVEEKSDTKHKFEANKRSDGFKQFVSILLNLSIENETGTLSNKVILLDEPETHLHPSGQKYLRDELLKISENNLVIYATHSIYMVDTKHLDRHMSVKKEGSLTQITQIDKNNPYGEEVLYNALGASVLEHIEPNVLIVEGKTDKDILELYFQKLKTDLKPPRLSIISADGANDVIKYVKFFNNKLIQGFVLLDSDKSGINAKKDILRECGCTTKNTFEINTLFDTKIEATLEDLFNKSHLKDAVNESFNFDISFDDNNPLMEQLKKKFQELKKPFKDTEKKELRQSFVKNINKLNKDDLEKEKFYKVAQALIVKIG